MKAKVIETGELIDVVTLDKGYGNIVFVDRNSEKVYENQELTLIKEIDWEQRRFELAKAALNGMLAHSRNGHGYHPRDPKMHWHDAIAEEAIEIADAVIEKLKEK